MTLDRILLYPYYLVLKCRNKRYSKPTFVPYRPEVPSVCVGNITVGGTGKTPQVEMLIRLLQSSEEWQGKQIAVVSLGYKRSSKGFQQVVGDGSAEMFGDEPLQIKKKFPDVTVVVDKNREEACDLLCHPEKMKSPKVAKKCWHREFPKADFIIFDDAFQYRKVKAARTIVLVDYNRPVHKDCLLPIGRLRDLKERIHEADIIVVTKAPVEISEEEKQAFILDMGVNGKPVLFSYIDYGKTVPAYDEAEPRYIYSNKAILATGIAKDTAIRNYLSEHYKIVRRFRFPDHHKYTWSDINKIQSAVRKQSTAAIITTEKDVQRFRDFSGMPKDIKERLFVVPIEANFVSHDELEEFRDIILSL